MLFVRILRRLGLGLSLAIFTIVLPLALFVVPISSVVQDKDHVRSWFESGGTYARFAPLIASQLASSERPDAEVGIQDTELEAVINEALPTDVLASYGHQIIDGFYSWVSGQTPKPRFRIDLSERRAELQASFRKLVTERLANAPVCTAPPADGEYDPFRDACVPPGQTPESTANQWVGQLFAADGPLSDLVLDSDKIFREADMSDHPLVKLYDVMGPLRIALIAAVVISGGLAVVLASEWRRGLKRISWITLTVSLITLSATLVLTWILPSLVKRTMVDAGDQDVNVTGLIIPVLTEALGDIGLRVTLIAAPLLLAATGVLIWLWRTNKPPTVVGSSDPEASKGASTK